jgi:hypothetical protein
MMKAVIEFTADTSQIAATARIIAKHLTALADELEHGNLSHAEPATETAPARQELSCTSASTERRPSYHHEAPATPFGFGR